MGGHYPMMQSPRRELSSQDAAEILGEGQFAVISTVDPDGAPYGVPLAYVMMDGSMYIHTGRAGVRKIRDFLHNARVCVTVACEIEPVFEESFFSTRYASVIAEGSIAKVEDDATRRAALEALCMKYLPGHKDQINAAIEREWDIVDIWRITFDEIRGKAGRRRR